MDVHVVQKKNYSLLKQCSHLKNDFFFFFFNYPQKEKNIGLLGRRQEIAPHLQYHKLNK